MSFETVDEMKVYPRSVVEENGTKYCLARRAGEKLLVVQGDVSGFVGKYQGDSLPARQAYSHSASVGSR